MKKFFVKEKKDVLSKVMKEVEKVVKKNIEVFVVSNDDFENEDLFEVVKVDWSDDDEDDDWEEEDKCCFDGKLGKLFLMFYVCYV